MPNPNVKTAKVDQNIRRSRNMTTHPALAGPRFRGPNGHDTPAPTGALTAGLDLRKSVLDFAQGKMPAPVPCAIPQETVRFPGPSTNEIGAT
jgi:hypothetical protein